MKYIAKLSILSFAACLAIVGCAKNEPPQTEPTPAPLRQNASKRNVPAWKRSSTRS